MAVTDTEPAPTALDPSGGASPRSLEELYKVAYEPMVRLAFLLTGSEEAARDIVQDAFVAMHGRWQGIREPHAYLRRAVANRCTSWHRRRALERRFSSRMSDERLALGADELSDALGRLPFKQRAALTLRFYEGCSEAEIAAALNCKPGSVGPLIHRGLEALRKVIER